MSIKLRNYTIFSLLIFCIVCYSLPTQAQDNSQEKPLSNEQKLMDAMHLISSHTLMDYVNELCTDKYEGRLTGTPAYNKSAEWVADSMKQWGVLPAGDNGTFFQDFPNPYTLVLDKGALILFIPVSKNQPNDTIEKQYAYETQYFTGGTSDSGEIKAEVVYVGYGITAPELNFDEYKGIDVKGKIVLLEREVPVSPFKDPELFKKWRPYSFHDYKVKNAYKHGAAGVLFDYKIANPNCFFIKGLIVSCVGNEVIADLFAGTGKTHKNVLEQIDKTLKPQSFSTRKTMLVKNNTQFHPEGIGKNVIGYIEGSDPQLKNEAIMIGGHLDHLGKSPELLPGANDNASAVAVMLEIAEAIQKSGLKPKRSIYFNFFGAEEQGVTGSDYYLQHPVIPNKNLVGLINMDGVGRGTKISALAGLDYPELWKPIDEANKKYIHREILPTNFPNLARPRLDAARFMWAGVPCISFSTFGSPELPYEAYHTTNDNPSLITPEIMEDLSQLIFIAVMEIAGY